MGKIIDGFAQLLAGLGYRAPPDPGNTANAPANPPVQYGNYEYIIPQMYPNQSIVNIPYVPSEFQDWDQYALNVQGISGLEGGGATGDVPQIENGSVFYYDTTTGQYVELPSI